MPKEPRGVIRPMSDTTLECCDVIKGKGLFSSDKYVSRNKNMKREDRKRGVSYLIRRGEMFEANFPTAIYMKALGNCYDHKQVRRAADLFIDHLQQQREHPVKLMAAYIKTRITILKWWMK